MLCLSIYDPHRHLMLNHYWKKNQESGAFEGGPTEEAATGWAWKHQKPIVIPDTQQEHRFPGCVPILMNHGIRSYTVLPMSTHTPHFGAVGLGKNIPETLKGEDVELLSCVANIGALTQERDRAARAVEEQHSLVEISHELNSNLGLDKLLPTILSSLRRIGRYEQAVLSLLDDEGKNERLYGDAVEWESYPIEQSLSAQAIRTRKPAFFTADELQERVL